MEPTVLTSLPTVVTVLGAAAIDSINPCAIGVLILMISVMLSQKHSVRRMLLLGGFYILAIFLTYLAAGLGLRISRRRDYWRRWMRITDTRSPSATAASR